MLEFIFGRRRGILLLVVIIGVAGFVLLGELPTTLYPAMRKPRVQVSVSHPAYTASDFYESYGDILENALLGTADLEHLEARYRNGNTRYRLEFDWGFDGDEVQSRVESSLAPVRNSLPEEARDYRIAAWRSDNPGMLSIAVFSTEMEPTELYQLIEPVLRGPLSRVHDAENVTIINVEELRAEVTLDHDAMLRYGLTPADVAREVQAGYRPSSVGTFRNDSSQYGVRVEQGIDSIFEIDRIRVASFENTSVLLRDVADVSVRYDLPRQIFRADGARSVMIYAEPKDGGNIRRMSADVAEILEGAAPGFPEHVQYRFLVDPADFIDTALGNVIFAAVLGASLAMGVIILLLGEFKNILIIGLSIPLSMLLTFILMYVFEISLNLISLGGMTLSIGMIIDSSIVVMENIHRHRRSGGGRRVDRALILESVREVRAAVVVSTLTSVIVFLPLPFTSPITAAILGDLARTVIFALGSALVVALTVIPLLAYYLFRGRMESKKSVAARLSEALLGRMTGAYRASLSALLSSRLASITFILGSFGALLALLVFVLPQVPMEIISEPDSDKVVLFFSNSETEDGEELMEAIEPVEQELLERYAADLESLFVQIRSASSGSMILSLGTSARRVEVEEELAELYPDSAEWRFRVFPWDPAAMPLPFVWDFHLQIEGPDDLVSVQVIDDLAEIMRESRVYNRVATSPSPSQAQELILSPRHEVIDAFPGYSLSGLVGIGRTILAGSRAIEMTEGRDTVSVRLVYPDGAVASRNDFESILVPYEGRGVPLRHFFDVRQRTGPTEIVTEDGVQSFNIYGMLPRYASEELRAERQAQAIELIHDTLRLPEGYSYRILNPRVEVDNSINSLFVALAVSLLAVFLVLTLQFNSVRVPLVILLTVPLGFMGVILALFLFDSTLSLNSLLGTILLGGIVVNNAIIMLDFYYRNGTAFDTRREALVHAATLRFAPIIITMSTTILGMLPIALALGDGTNVIQPLGISVSGGLFVSTLFTLYMVPCVMNLIPGLDATRRAQKRASE